MGIVVGCAWLAGCAVGVREEAPEPEGFAASAGGSTPDDSAEQSLVSHADAGPALPGETPPEEQSEVPDAIADEQAPSDSGAALPEPPDQNVGTDLPEDTPEPNEPEPEPAPTQTGPNCLGASQCPAEFPRCGANGVCHRGDVGDACIGNSQCDVAPLCSPNGECQHGVAGDPCFATSHCQAGLSCSSSGSCG